MHQYELGRKETAIISTQQTHLCLAEPYPSGGPLTPRTKSHSEDFLLIFLFLSSALVMEALLTFLVRNLFQKKFKGELCFLLSVINKK